LNYASKAGCKHDTAEKPNNNRLCFDAQMGEDIGADMRRYIRIILGVDVIVYDRQQAHLLCSSDGIRLRDVSEELKADRELVKVAVNANGLALGFASEHLRADKEIVLDAVKQNGSALYHAAQQLRNDMDIVLTAVKQFGPALEYASLRLRNDLDIVLTTVKQSGTSLCYASIALKSNRVVVLAAVKSSGIALYYASEQLQSDPEIVLAAVKHSGRFALQRASVELRTDAYLRRLATEVDIARAYPIVAAFMRYARNLREAKIKAQVDLWLTVHDDGALLHWVDATHRLSKAHKRARTE
jgi:hypothetical protein